MASYSFYRKYRSQSFGEMVGQDHIKLTLQNAIQHNRISHAYIFSGPRGTGKTSAARILAKSLNCESGPTITPCQTCALCRRITTGNAVDVIEIDAASNTGVDHIRSLNDQVQFAPVECRFKIIIIDEVHMLSSGAFNALLKTLEEPPANTIFVLATTEPHKIPATIHSRCQQLHFRRLQVSEIVQQLRWISEQESLTISDAALRVIAQNAEGCMRDAVALLDQIGSFENGAIDEGHVQQILGATDQNRLMALVAAMIQVDMETSVRLYRQMVADGISIAQLARDLGRIIRDLIFVRLGIADQVETDPELLKTVSNVEIGALKFWLETIAKVEQESKGLPNPEAYFQVKLMTAIYDGAGTVISAAPPVQRPTSTPTIIHPVSPPAPPIVPTMPSEPSPDSPPQAPKNRGSITKDWSQVVAAIKGKRPSLFTILLQSSVKEVGPQQIQIQLQQNFPFFTEKLKEPQNKNTIEAVCAQIGYPGYQVVFAADSPVAQQVQTEPPASLGASLSKPVLEKSSGANHRSRSADRSINEIVAMFEGTIL